MIIETGANGFNLLIPLLSFSVNVTFQAFLFRSRSCGLLKSEYIGFTLGLVLLLSLQISLHPMLLELTLDALAIVIVNLLIAITHNDIKERLFVNIPNIKSLFIEKRSAWINFSIT